MFEHSKEKSKYLRKKPVIWNVPSRNLMVGVQTDKVCQKENQDACE